MLLGVLILCTDDSSRGGEVCIYPGQQTLNGEQALVYARNRKQLVNGDFGRGQHQQEIVMALINKMRTITDVTTFMDILNTVSNSLDTNLTTQQILSFYNVGKDIVRRSLATDNYVPNQDSRDDMIQAMTENLELADHEPITEFSFSINEPYEKEVIGYGPYRTSYTYDLLPDFTGDSEAQARATASRLGISVTFVGSGGYVVDQEYPSGKRIDKIRGSVTLTLSGSVVYEPEEDDNSNSSSSNNNTTTLPSDDDDENTGGGNSSESGGGNGSDSGGSDGGSDSEEEVIDPPLTDSGLVPGT